LVWNDKKLSAHHAIIPTNNTQVSVSGMTTDESKLYDLIWKFLWDNKPNQIERNVCCLNINEGGMGMINTFPP
jgi:DNA topoisomerase IA